MAAGGGAMLVSTRRTDGAPLNQRTRGRQGVPEPSGFDPDIDPLRSQLSSWYLPSVLRSLLN